MKVGEKPAAFANLCLQKAPCIGCLLLHLELVTTQEPTPEFYDQSPRLSGLEG